MLKQWGWGAGSTIWLRFRVSYAVSPEQQAKIFAKENLPSWLNCLANDYEHWHYDNLGQVKQSYVGEPLKGYTISENIDLSKSINEQKKLESFYDVPVLYDGKIVTDIHVYCNKKNTWEVIGIGGSLSKTIDLVCKDNGISSEDISVKHRVSTLPLYQPLHYEILEVKMRNKNEP